MSFFARVFSFVVDKLLVETLAKRCACCCGCSPTRLHTWPNHHASGRCLLLAWRAVVNCRVELAGVGMSKRCQTGFAHRASPLMTFPERPLVIFDFGMTHVLSRSTRHRKVRMRLTA